MHEMWNYSLWTYLLFSDSYLDKLWWLWQYQKLTCWAFTRTQITEGNSFWSWFQISADSDISTISYRVLRYPIWYQPYNITRYWGRYCQCGRFCRYGQPILPVLIVKTIGQYGYSYRDFKPKILNMKVDANHKINIIKKNLLHLLPKKLLHV